MDFRICDVEYMIVLKNDLSMAEITPVLVMDATKSQTLIATVTIDNMEMIPSFRVPAQAGSNRITIKSFRIFNPLVRQPDDPADIKTYEMELLLGTSGDQLISHRSKIAITPECIGEV